MKKILTILFGATAILVNSQTSDNRWNVGLHGGLTQYNGDLGNGFYTFDQAFYGHIGLSVSRYLTRRLDVTAFLTRGELGFLQPYNTITGTNGNNFRIRLSTGNLLLRYHFLDPEQFVRPYVFIGAGILRQVALSDQITGNTYDWATPSAGAGINFRLPYGFRIQLQELFMYTTRDNIDMMEGGINDMYLFHSVGLTYNLPKLNGRGGGGNKGGVGDKIDKCPALSEKDRSNDRNVQRENSRDKHRSKKDKTHKKKKLMD